ncbi:unnamed protein product [Kuraishia capsulata CBS 1993]|uniref:Zn(2)-C6 fungal-type domain-containing protein n=1 Tax=Kuraishia capsulata CBS 1993 TaxID=1382522 RepID=W6MHP2_9ASCO|nr:uncharacterized protein KUCA_T00001265001 [Kuraishia capsulata CBS 1993]CDK25298.1 unnamed protein product [Kuraishia capsulata CBS 1993]
MGTEIGMQQETISCQVCRKRKIKCDRLVGGCSRCATFGELCSYTKGETGQSPRRDPNELSQAGFERRRVWKSCDECKRSKSKCTGGTKCQRCTRRNLDCSFGVAQNIQPADNKDVDLIPAWMRSECLPEPIVIKELVGIFFRRIHTARCLGFIHIPTFTEQMKSTIDNGGKDNALLHIICALAAPFYLHEVLAPEVTNSTLDDPPQYFMAGDGWATAAQTLLLSSFGSTSIEKLMAAVLLHDYYLRVGSHGSAFFISGLITRYVQILQLNIEYDYDILCEDGRVSWASKESRRRLAWACFLLDAFIECGIDQLRFMSASDMKIQLPCAEELFINNIPCITETLNKGTILPFLRTKVTNAADKLDVRAYYIRCMVIRAKILRYVKHLENEIPWEANSTFKTLESQLIDLEASLPPSLIMNKENTYLHQVSETLNQFYGLQIMLAQSFHDLHRVAVPQLVFPNSATQKIRDNAPKSFIHSCYKTCTSSAVRIACMLKDLWTCERMDLIDLPFLSHVQVCSRVLITCLTTWNDSEPLFPIYPDRFYTNLLESNRNILGYLRSFLKADQYYESATLSLKVWEKYLELKNSKQLQRVNSNKDSSVNPPQFSLEYILNPLGTYPMARQRAAEKHSPETLLSPVSNLQQLHDQQQAPISDPFDREVAETANGLNIEEFIDYSSVGNPFGDWLGELTRFDAVGFPIAN